MIEYMSFRRYPHENFEQFISRYELVRERSRTDGKFAISIEGCAMQVFEEMHVTA